MKTAALVMLTVATLVTVVAVWWMLVRGGLDPDNGGAAVCFTVAALCAPLLAWLVTRRHPDEWTGVLLGAMVLLGMVPAARYSDLGSPMQSMVAVVTLTTALLPAVVALRHPFLAAGRRVTATVLCCFALTIVSGAVIGAGTDAVPTSWWYTAQPAPASTAGALAMWIQTAAVVAAAACTAIVVAHRYRRSSKAGRVALRPLVQPLVAWSVFVAASEVWTSAVGAASPAVEPTPAQLSLAVVIPVLLVVILGAGLGWIDLVVRPSSARTGAGPQPPGERVQRLLSRALADPSIRVLYPSPDTGRWVDAMGRPAEPAGDLGDRACTVVSRGSRVIGLIEHDAAIATRPDAVELVATGAGLLMETERLTADANADLEHSRELAGRLLSVSDEPREQLRNALLDGPLRELDEIAAELADGLALSAAATRLNDVAAEVRTISHGVYPPELMAGGLRAALPQIPVPSGRYPPAVELTAYLAVRDDPAARLVEGRQGAEPALVLQTSSAPGTVVTDRINALGGTVAPRDGGWTATLPTVSAGPASG